MQTPAAVPWTPRPTSPLPDAERAAWGWDPGAPDARDAALSRAWWAEAAWHAGARTRGGRERRDRIRWCGRLRAAYAEVLGDEVHGVASRPCLDRLCPTCQVRKARRDAELLREYFAVAARAHPDGDDGFAFVTLTQRRRPGEPLALALDRLMGAWRRTWNRKYAAGRKVAAFVTGAMRVVEVAADPHKGWHPHIHALVELAPGVTRREFQAVILAAWLEVADAERWGQDVRRVDAGRLKQLCKYVVKPFALGNGSQSMAVELARVLPGRRMSAGLGSWLSWRREAESWRPDDVGPVVRMSNQHLATLIEHDVAGVSGQLVVYDHPSPDVPQVVRSWGDVRGAVKGSRGETVWDAVRRVVGDEVSSGVGASPDSSHKNAETPLREVRKQAIFDG